MSGYPLWDCPEDCLPMNEILAILQQKSGDVQRKLAGNMMHVGVVGVLCGAILLAM